jgi:hypothetical protein
MFVKMKKMIMSIQLFGANCSRSIKLKIKKLIDINQDLE